MAAWLIADAQLVLRPGTVVRGEAADLVSVFFGEDNQTTAPPAYVTANVTGAPSA